MARYGNPYYGRGGYDADFGGGRYLGGSGWWNGNRSEVENRGWGSEGGREWRGDRGYPRYGADYGGSGIGRGFGFGVGGGLGGAQRFGPGSMDRGYDRPYRGGGYGGGGYGGGSYGGGYGRGHGYGDRGFSGRGYGRDDRDLGDQMREGWNDLKRGVRRAFGNDRYDRGW